MASVSLKDFIKALERGRPPNIVQLFPNSKALIVSGKVIDRAMILKGKAMTIAEPSAAAAQVVGTASRTSRRCCLRLGGVHSVTIP